MNTTILKYDAEYASQVMSCIPVGYIDKTVCGCGITTVAIENNDNVIIAVPSIELIRNKTAQYPNKRYKKAILGVYGLVTTKEIDAYIRASETNNDPIKIMVTYDSLPRLEYLLKDKGCKLIIDESNKLISSSSMKSFSKKVDSIDAVTTVFNIAEEYKDRVSFVSATPTPLEYLPEWVSTIPNIKIEWANTIKAKPMLMKRTYPYKAVTEEVVMPLQEHGTLTIGDSTFSKVIIFINSVDAIVKIAKKAELDKKDVAIIAGDSVKNDVKIRGFNRLQDPTNLPKFTFITSSGFEGIDLEDKDAVSVVVSSTKRDYQMVDVMTDLKQAISRQRNKLNPNYDKFLYIYNMSVFAQSREELVETLDNKYRKLQKAINMWDTVKGTNNEEGFEYTANAEEFSTYTNYYSDTNEYVINENLFNADKYFLLNIREQYKKGFDIRSLYKEEESTVVEAPVTVENISYRDMVASYYVNESLEDIKQYMYKSEYYNLIEQSIKLYGKVWKDYTYTKTMVNSFNDDYSKLKADLGLRFTIDNAYTNKEIKKILKELYTKHDIARSPKATDLNEFYTTQIVFIKRQRHIKIVSKI